MRTVSFTAPSTAKEGVSISRASRWGSSQMTSSSSWVSCSFTSTADSFTSIFPNGKRRIVFSTLNTVWKTEMPTLFTCESAQFPLKENITNIPMPNTTAPTTLKSRWITAARFAVRFAPRLDNRAVTQVPMFCPRVMNTAELQFTTPLAASVCRIPTEAEELWMIAVTTRPVRMPRIGLLPRIRNASEKMGASR